MLVVSHVLSCSLAPENDYLFCTVLWLLITELLVTSNSLIAENCDLVF